MLFELNGLIYKNILKIKEMKIEENKTTCIIGESGAGKSTLLKLLNKIYIPDDGSILFKGEPIKDMDPIQLRRRAVMISQAPLLFGETVEDNLQSGLCFSEKQKAGEDELERVLKIVQLEKDLNKRAEELSGGERQRLSLGRVLLMKPEVYLLDEPTSALDEETELAVMKGFISAAENHNGTVVMVTHSMNVAEQYGEDLIRIKND
ncbi:ABC transporter ATP-binding protein [Rossellomorea aquimaris]|uniref:ABC transporter ATP-binding protein n=1 Tax=Rossellomorea aquimaris TaxID=189382 RepID=UPI001CD2E1D2|nr:ABC transporter ATP-binding protein [Rossellomorea aquimaris]MCA1056634.1 ABC transporter ATP-binding protein [Rossellomorea aquimaris]